MCVVFTCVCLLVCVRVCVCLSEYWCVCTCVSVSTVGPGQFEPGWYVTPLNQSVFPCNDRVEFSGTHCTLVKPAPRTPLNHHAHVFSPQDITCDTTSEFCEMLLPPCARGSPFCFPVPVCRHVCTRHRCDRDQTCRPEQYVATPRAKCVGKF